MPMQDQAVWANVNVVVGGEPQSFSRGELLPDAASSEELSQRQLLRVGGAIRTVEVVYTEAELAAQAQARAVQGAELAAQHDVDPDLPLGDQLPGTGPVGPPTLETGAGAPVVVGPEPKEPPPAKAPARRGAAAKE